MSYLGNPLVAMNYPVDYFTGTGTTTTFSLSRVPASPSSILVYIGGVKQISSVSNPAYYTNGSQLVLSEAPAAGSPIEVTYLGVLSQVNVPADQSITSNMLSLTLSNTFVYQTTANGTGNTYTLNAPPVSANSLIVTANGIIQYDYSVNGANLTLNFTPSAGTLIRAQALSLSQSGVPNDGSVTNIKIATGAVTSDKIVSVANTQITGSITASQLDVVSLNGTGAMILPTGNTAQRPDSPTIGMIRQNTTTGNPEWWDASTSSWHQFSQPAGYSVNYLVVAGGGGGGYLIGGGGGAGGLLSSSITLSSGVSYAITVGAGGAGGTTSVNAVSGNDSSFNTFATALGGGGGGSSYQNGRAGGSGGGGSRSSSPGAAIQLGGSGTVGQGFSGGNGSNSGGSDGYGGGGGGGGSASAGFASISGNGGNGGNAVSSAISGTPTSYAGGGGGGAYGATAGIGGGGGAANGAVYSSNSPNATANTGGGGGGGGNNGGNGGSGIVIIAYLGSQRGTGGTVTSSGGYTIHTFTSSGTYNA